LYIVEKIILKPWKMSDIDAFNWFLELNILGEIIGLENDKPIDTLKYITIIDSFLNAYIVYRIMLKEFLKTI